MAKDLDSELAANLKTAKTKRMYFAFIAKGSNDGALVLAKGKVAPVLINDAKKKSGGTSVVKGACFGEDGKLVFEMATEPPGTMEAALKKVIHNDTGLTQVCVCRRGTNPDLLDENAPPQTPPTAPPKAPVKSQGSPPPTKSSTPPTQTPPTTQPTNDLASKYLSLQHEVEPQLTKALKEKKGDTEKMKTVFTFARENASKKQYDKAIQGLSALRNLIGGAYSQPELHPEGYGDLAKEMEESETEEETGKKPKMPYGMAEDTLGTAPYSKVVDSGDEEEEEEGEGDDKKKYLVGEGEEEEEEEQDDEKKYLKTDNEDDEDDDDEDHEDEDDEDEDDEDPEFGEVPMNAEERERIEKKKQKQLRKQRLANQQKLVPQSVKSDFSKGLKLDTYKTGRKLGAGAFGETELLESTESGQPPLVIKTPLAESGVADLQKEIEFYKKVGDHPNFAKCVGVMDVDGQRGLVLEAVKGKDMGKTMKMLKDQYASGKISHQQYWGAVQHTMRQTLEAIAHLEECGIVHNDIRMDNIMCDQETGQMKVLDFGISVQSGEQIGVAPVGYGTVSPDAYGDRTEKGTPKKSAVTSKHDVFSVGAATYEAGEKQQFDYHSGSGRGEWAAMFKFAEPDEEGGQKQAIRPGDKENPAFEMKKKTFGEDEEGDAIVEKTPQKVAGRSGANTSYTDFVNALMNPDPSKRMSVAEALQHPFLSDSIMDGEEAGKFLSKLLTPPKPPEGSGGTPEGGEKEGEEVDVASVLRESGFGGYGSKPSGESDPSKYGNKGGDSDPSKYLQTEEEEEEEEGGKKKGGGSYEPLGSGGDPSKYLRTDEEEEEEGEGGKKKGTGSYEPL